MFLLLLVLLQLSLSGSHSPTSWEIRAGTDVEIAFEFISNSSIKTKSELSLYKNDTKIGGLQNLTKTCPQFSSVQNQQIEFCILSLNSNMIRLHFINPAVNDSGTYYLALISEALTIIESKRINLNVHPSDVTTAPALTSSSKNNTSSPHINSGTISLWIIFSMLVISLVLGIIGLLVWSCKMNQSKSDADTPAPNPSITQQGRSPKLSTEPVVSCVEYGVLDFQNRPIRPERHSTEVVAGEAGVEYAAIMFPPQNKK